VKLFIFARFHARPESESLLGETLLAVSAETRAESDCLDHHVFRSIQDPRLFYIHSQWTNEAAFERHIGLPHTLRFVERVELLIDHRLDVSRTHMFDRT
jgi:quinol monooxygenase YgiN